MENTPTSASIADDEIETLIPADDLEKLRASGERLNYTVVDTWDGQKAVVFRGLTPAQRERAEEMFDDNKRKKLVAKTVFRDVIVYPLGQARAALLEECPGIPDQVATLALALSRGDRMEEAKKLVPSSPKPAATRTSAPGA
jgi:hypothetical protein